MRYFLLLLIFFLSALSLHAQKKKPDFIDKDDKRKVEKAKKHLKKGQNLKG